VKIGPPYPDGYTVGEGRRAAIAKAARAQQPAWSCRAAPAIRRGP